MPRHAASARKYKPIKQDPSAYQCPNAQAAAAKARSPSPEEIERKLRTIPGPTVPPSTPEQVERVLAMVAPAAKRPTPLWLRLLLRFEILFVWAVSAVFCIVFWFVIAREIWGIAPILWRITGETIDRALWMIT